MSKVVYIAEVIVDVPTMQTDTPFSYAIPLELGAKVQAGMRVEVPFGNGNRHVQGFVVSIIEKNPDQIDFELKEIVAVLDLAPVLSTEMLELADEMKAKTFSFKITCLQTMLPSVMRASYQKWVCLIDEVPEEIQYGVFKGLAEITWEDAVASEHFSTLMKLKAEERIEVRYEVKQRNRSKTINAFRARLSFERLEEEREGLRKNATQKLRLLAFLQSLGQESITVKQAMEDHELSRGVINAGEVAGWLEIFEEEIYRDPYANRHFEKSTPLNLNNQQGNALEKISEAMKQKKAETFLLEGITGSGKTEVYLQAIAQALDKQQSAIMLVPEISLTPQTVERFKSRFGDEVAVLHSGLSQGEKYDEWRKIERKEAHVVVGARSAIFAPLDNIGVIIVDEEHEGSYKQDESPRYHARDLAIWRGKYHECPIVLGSATPSLESRARAQKNVYQLLVLDERANAQAKLPEIEIIDMRREFQQKNSSTFSRLLKEKIQDRLTKQEQTVLMLNRRGYSSFIMCRDCGYVLPCPNCDISLTLHMDSKTMKCHYCGHEEGIPRKCPICASDKIRYYGTGTQKVEEELQELFPASRILRMDVDTTRKKGSHERILAKFGHREADILLGTQMIAKGLDFPDVTLVGVLNADTSLNLPDFRASERTFQLLTQVSGRAGRAEKAGEVVIQTFNPEHYAIQFAEQQNYEGFYRNEMHARHQGHYPPYYFTVQLVTSHTEENTAAKKMYEIVEELKRVLSPDCMILGPTPKAVMRVNNRYFYQTVIKYKKEPRLESALKKILNDTQKDIQKGLRISIDVEPMHFI